MSLIQNFDAIAMTDLRRDFLSGLAAGIMHIKPEYILNHRIMGFNNTREMNNAILVDRTGGLLIGTIDQNMTAHVETIYNVISKILKGDATEERYLIKPIAIPAAAVSEK